MFHIVVRMCQTYQLSLESALSQRDYNRGSAVGRGPQSSVRHILEYRSSKIIDGQISIKYNKIKKKKKGNHDPRCKINKKLRFS